MPYGATAAQGAAGDPASHPRASVPGKSSSSFKVPGFVGGDSGSSSSNSNSEANHFGGETRATSTTFAGAMQALLKPARPSAAPAEAKPERPQAQFRPRSSLDLSGHSFSKTIRAEINQSKLTGKTNSRGGSGVPRHDWWDKSGGLGMDDSLSRAAPPRAAPTAVGGGGSALQHQQRQRLQQQQQQQQQSMSMRRPRSSGGQLFDEISRAVGLQ